MKILIFSLSLLLFYLQYALWFGQKGYQEISKLEKNIAEQRRKNEQLKRTNDTLIANIQELKAGGIAVEERARMELGMVKKGEVFYQFIEK